jgi:hypothetical protein
VVPSVAETPAASAAVPAEALAAVVVVVDSVAAAVEAEASTAGWDPTILARFVSASLSPHQTPLLLSLPTRREFYVERKWAYPRNN